MSPGVVLAAGGVGFAVVAVLLGVRRAPVLLAALSGATGAALVASALTAPSDAAVRVGALGGLLLLPVLLLLVPTGRPAGWPGRLVLSTVLGTGTLAVLLPEAFTVSALAGMVQGIALVAALWTRSETARGPGAEAERTAVLWLALTSGGVLLVVGHLFFLADGPVVWVTAAAVGLAVPAGVAVAVLRPDVTDVRVLIARAVVEATALVAVVALFVTLAAGAEAITGRRPGVGATAVVAAACALVLHPVRVVLRGAVQRLLFGDREDVVTAASRVGAGLDDDPVLALRALREALGLPWAVLTSGADEDRREVARTGPVAPPGHRIALGTPARPLGELEVGLPPGRARMPAEDRRVLDVVAPALAQALRARALAEQVQESRAGVVTAVEDERRRLRDDLHDGLGPTLTGIAFTADAAGNVVRSDPERAATLLAGLRADATDAIAEVRRIVDGLRPPAVDELGLVGALRQQVRHLHAADGRPLAVRLDAPDPAPELPAAVEVAAYRIVVEALTNVARHAGCSTAAVALARRDDDLLLEISDDGPGAGPWVPGVGLTSMRQRAELLGGTFSATTGPGGGRVLVSLPV